MNVNEQKGVAYDKLQKMRELIEEQLQESLNDVKGAVPEEWEDTLLYISGMQRHLKKVSDNLEFAVSSLDDKR
ncbi:MAG: hypothetical protein ACMXYD_04340 [Candidatus Woesearchaeota archaeon]